ncbi:hypothetical protein PMAYCL1PPCAC_27701, partial [Pristionchus mayeri]
YQAVPERVNPCKPSTIGMKWYGSKEHPHHRLAGLSPSNTIEGFVTCKAGQWIMWCESCYATIGVDAVSCCYLIY